MRERRRVGASLSFYHPLDAVLLKATYSERDHPPQEETMKTIQTIRVEDVQAAMAQAMKFSLKEERNNPGVKEHLELAKELGRLLVESK